MMRSRCLEARNRSGLASGWPALNKSRFSTPVCWVNVSTAISGWSAASDRPAEGGSPKIACWTGLRKSQSVSYTHLDVYKRQVWASPEMAILVQRTCFTIRSVMSSSIGVCRTISAKHRKRCGLRVLSLIHI